MKDTATVRIEYVEDEGALTRPRARVPETMSDALRTAAGILTGILAGSAIWLVLAAFLLRL